MPNLSFLAKKSWNVTNLSNIEKVWLAERNKDAESKKLAELRVQIREEQEGQSWPAVSRRICARRRRSSHWLGCLSLVRQVRKGRPGAASGLVAHNCEGKGNQSVAGMPLSREAGARGKGRLPSHGQRPRGSCV